jgi:hypothetical protein
LARISAEQGIPMKPGMIGSGIAAGFVATVVLSAMMLIKHYIGLEIGGIAARRCSVKTKLTACQEHSRDPEKLPHSRRAGAAGGAVGRRRNANCLHRVVDGKFTTIQDVAEAALFFVAATTNMPTGPAPHRQPRRFME